MHFIVTETTTGVADLDLGAVANDTDFKVIVSAKAGRFVGAVEGNSAATPDTAGNFPTVDTLRTGHDVTGSHWQSTIATVKIRKTFDEAAVDAIAA
ncbi:MAG: hypothetical protein IIB87_04335 [Chloroflexi bacterium]|nr:hypothetical protein [Chloroflexota bacterium]